MIKHLVRLFPLLFLFSAVLADAQAARTSTTPNPGTRITNAGASVQACRERLYSVFPVTHLISPQGVHVAVAEKDLEAALGRGFKYDLQALRDEAKTYGNGEKGSPEQAILAKLSDEQLTALHDDIANCGIEHQELLSRKDLVNWGIAMAEIAGFQNYRSIGHLLVENDEERVKQYNTLAAKYDDLIARCWPCKTHLPRVINYRQPAIGVWHDGKVMRRQNGNCLRGFAEDCDGG